MYIYIYVYIYIYIIHMCTYYSTGSQVKSSLDALSPRVMLSQSDSRRLAGGGHSYRL